MMQKKTVIEYLRALDLLSPDLLGELLHLLSVEHLIPKQVWHAGVNTPGRVWYVEEGLVYAYYLRDDGQPVTTGFFGPGDTFLLYENSGPGNGSEYLEAIQPSVLQAVSFNRLDGLFSRFDDMRSLAAYILRKHQFREVFRMRLLDLSATQRYREFRKAFPHLFSLVPLRLIASYLHMSRENLSRLIGRDRD